jgi:hypothetical protein
MHKAADALNPMAFGLNTTWMPYERSVGVSYLSITMMLYLEHENNSRHLKISLLKHHLCIADLDIHLSCPSLWGHRCSPSSLLQQKMERQPHYRQPPQLPVSAAAVSGQRQRHNRPPWQEQAVAPLLRKEESVM